MSQFVACDVMLAMDQEAKMEDGIQSPGTPDSRKRPLDIENEDAITKRSHFIPGISLLIIGAKFDGVKIWHSSIFGCFKLGSSFPL